MIEIPGYSIRRELGRGAMGVVLEAVQESSGRRVAIKLMQAANPDPASLGRFEREARTLTALRHPHIVEIIDGGCVGDTRFLVLEFLEGEDFKDHIEGIVKRTGAALEPGEALALLSPMADALAHLHERGLLHRDVKPENLFLARGPDGPRPVLVDFGLVRADSDMDSSRGLTRTGEIVGTPAWMAPEQLSPGGSFGAVGPKSDVWGWAGSLVFALTGRPPFNYSTMIEIFSAITGGETPDLARHRPDLPPALIELCEDCFALQPDDRPDMHEVCARLVELGAESDADARPGRGGLAIGVVGLLVILVLLGLRLWPEPLRLVDPGDWPDETRERALTLRCRVNHPGARLRLGGETVTADAEGRVEARIALAEGLNSLVLESLEGDTTRALRSARIVCDARPPEVTIQGLESDARRVLVGPDRTIELSVKDASPPLTIRLDEEIVRAELRGVHASLVVPGSLVRLSVTDRLGNTFRQWIEVLDPKVDRKARAPLADLALWRQTSEVLQDRLIALVTESVAASCRFVGTRTFRSGELETRVARYEHMRTGLELVLVPGGSIEVPWYLSPEDLYSGVLLDALGEEDATEEILSDALYDDDFRYREELREAHGMPAGIGWRQGLSELRRRGLAPALRVACRGLRERHRRDTLIATTTETVPALLVGRFEVSEATFSQLLRDRSTSELPRRRVSIEILNQWLTRAGGGLRLPSWIEWRHACRAGARSRFYWGSARTPPATECWTWQNSDDGNPHPVRERSETGNAVGLVNTLGNASEWATVDTVRWAGILDEAARSAEAARAGQLRDGAKALRSRSLALRLGSCSDWWAGWARCDMVNPSTRSHRSSKAGFRVVLPVRLKE